MLKIKNIGDSLLVVGEEVSERDLLMSMLNGVGQDYDPVVVLISSQNTTTTLEDAHFMSWLIWIRLVLTLSCSYKHQIISLLSTTTNDIIPVIKDHEDLIDKRRVFLSDIRDDNPLNCIVSKVKIAKFAANIDLEAKEKKIPPCDLYYDMKYTLQYLTFTNMLSLFLLFYNDTSSTISSESGSNNVPVDPEMRLLDLYSGCGAMSTGLCIGASLSGVKLVTRWAVDINPHACKSLKKNHPETQVRNEAAEDFLSLLKEWSNLCQKFARDKEPDQSSDLVIKEEEEEEEEKEEGEKEEEEEEEGEKEEKEEENENDDDSSVSDGEFEVEKLLAVCYGDPNKVKKPGVHFKVRWKGYGPKDDTWEPIDGLSDCQEKVKEFVTKGVMLMLFVADHHVKGSAVSIGSETRKLLWKM
ncbi:hypothetical protein ACOSP7_003804 [Xanthoceras sorbifolium]